MQTKDSRRAADARNLVRTLAAYREPSDVRSAVEVLLTAVPFALLWLLAWASLSVSYWLTLLLAVPSAAFLVRLFLIQHDCGHGALFRRRATNDALGRALGVLTMTPYAFWQRTHAIHHAASGNLDQRGIGDVDTLTVREYRARSVWGRLAYRIYRHPLVLFGIGPSYQFMLRHRLPFGLMRAGWQPWLSTMGTNAAILLMGAAMAWLIGLGPFLLVHLPIVALAASTGVWLFYVQHQFEETHWAPDPEWNWHEAALHGSSHYHLPAPLRWLTANIGVHHVHHLASRIPFYRLPEVLRDHPSLAEVGRLTLADSLRTVRLVLWDENERQLISIGELRRRTRASAGSVERFSTAAEA